MEVVHGRLLSYPLYVVTTSYRGRPVTIRGTKTPGTPVGSGASHTRNNVATERGLHGQVSENADTVVWPVFPGRIR